MNTPDRDLDVGAIARSFKACADQGYAVYAPWVEDTIAGGSTDRPEIERLLDGMLGFCYEKRMLELFRRLCRYYWDIDKVATAEYVLAYRDMWDNPEDT